MSTQSTPKIPADASLAGVTLRVRDLDAMVSYYRDSFGISVTSTGAGARLQPSGGRVYIDMIHDASAPVRPYPCVGLYHFALLFETRHELGGMLRKLLDGNAQFEGFADHGVSEAIYLRDPEFNGIELYWDRPQDQWRRVDGSIDMFTKSLDIQDLLDGAESCVIGAGTTLGHVHFHVDDLTAAKTFYSETLGLNNTASIRGAEFMAAGNYHHHVGLNIWAGSKRAPSGSTGMDFFEWRVGAESWHTDPAGIRIKLS